MTQLSVILPVYQSEKFLSLVLKRIIQEVSKHFTYFEIICVDDGSRDRSWSVIQELSSQYPQVVGLRLSRNFGQWPATVCGLQTSKGAVLLTMDDDGQCDPEQAMKLVELVVTGHHDVVCGMKKDLKSASWEFFSRLFFSKRHTSSFVALRREVIFSALNQSCFRMGLDAHLKWALDPNKIHHEYVTGHARVCGRSSYNLISRAKPVLENLVNYFGYREILTIIAIFWAVSVGLLGFLNGAILVLGFLMLGSILYLSVVLAELRGRPYYWVIEKCPKV